MKQSGDCFTVQSDVASSDAVLTSYREILTSVFHADLASGSGLRGSTAKHERYRVLHGRAAFPPDALGFDPACETQSKSSKLTMFRLPNQRPERESNALSRKKALGRACARQGVQIRLSFSGSNQAREGRLVDALAARGDEGRDTLR